MRENIRLALGTMMVLTGIITLQPNLQAQVTENYIVVSGQVTNNEYGNAIKNHSVFFLKDSTVTIDSGPLLTEIVTDDEGFYYDTIPTRTSKGSLLIYTDDYFGITSDTLKYYRFVTYTSSNYIITDFNIFMPVQAELLQSRFTQQQKKNGNPYRFRFIDQTEHDQITSWYWTFGDGTTSDVQHPDHTFPGPGMYKVRLTTTAMIENVKQSSTVLRVVYIADRSFFHMGGHAYAGYFPANNCIAYLYYIDTNQYVIPVDTVSVDTLGYYSFLQVPSGNYYIKVQPKKTSDLYGSMLPTYYGNAIFWEDASQIVHDKTYWGYHVYFVEGVGINSGNGNISGNVKYIEISEGNDFDLPAQGIDIYVLDEANQTLVSHYSDQAGAFEFPDVALGTYWLFPEVTGLNQKKVRVEVTVDEPDVSDIEIILTPGNIDGIGDAEHFVQENFLGLPYPNPATDWVNTPIESNGFSVAAIEIFDLQGRKIFSRQLQLQSGANTLSLKTSGLKCGTYIVRASVNGTVSERQFIVSR
ncbi:MAG: PKD domain-containing protein [Bacteroidales bacterium]|nr:PKD domain-containing protein [Bacteroidales bacterium]